MHILVKPRYRITYLLPSLLATLALIWARQWLNVALNKKQKSQDPSWILLFVGVWETGTFILFLFGATLSH